MAQKVMQISVFKAQCIEALKDVDRTGRSVAVTLRGKVLAVVHPSPRVRRLGALAGECEIVGDLLAANFEDEWEMNR